MMTALKGTRQEGPKFKCMVRLRYIVTLCLKKNDIMRRREERRGHGRGGEGRGGRKEKEKCFLKQ